MGKPLKFMHELGTKHLIKRCLGSAHCQNSSIKKDEILKRSISIENIFYIKI